jgi:hypothetical protein
LKLIVITMRVSLSLFLSIFLASEAIAATCKVTYAFKATVKAQKYPCTKSCDSLIKAIKPGNECIRLGFTTLHCVCSDLVGGCGEFATPEFLDQWFVPTINVV